MADEELKCECVRHHAPKSPIVVVGDTPVCLVTAHAVDLLCQAYERKGRIVKAHQRGYTRFQRELSERVWNERKSSQKL